MHLRPIEMSCGHRVNGQDLLLLADLLTLDTAQVISPKQFQLIPYTPEQYRLAKSAGRKVCFKSARRPKKSLGQSKKCVS